LAFGFVVILHIAFIDNELPISAGKKPSVVMQIVNPVGGSEVLLAKC